MQLDKVRKQATESAGLVASLEEELFSLQRNQGSSVQVLALPCLVSGTRLISIADRLTGLCCCWSCPSGQHLSSANWSGMPA